MAKMEIELTDEQLKKVEILKENDIDVGQAIDMLFEFKDEVENQKNSYIDSMLDDAEKQKAELEEQISQLDEDISILGKLKLFATFLISSLSVAIITLSMQIELFAALAVQ